MRIRNLSVEDRGQWEALWQGYLRFYQQTLSDQQTELTWHRLLNSEAGLNALVAELDDALVGLAHYWWTPSTWIENQDLYLEDLFVLPAARGNGVAKALIQKLVMVCQEAGGTKVHWQTHRDNSTARALYESLGQLSEFVVYEIKLKPKH